MTRLPHLRRALAVTTLGFAGLLGACSDFGPTIPGRSESQIHASVSRHVDSVPRSAESSALAGQDPFVIAAPYASLNVFASLSVDEQHFAVNPELITDAEFDSVGALVIGAAQEQLYQDDGIAVESAIANGAGGGGHIAEIDARRSDRPARHRGRSVRTCACGEWVL